MTFKSLIRSALTGLALQPRTDQGAHPEQTSAAGCLPPELLHLIFDYLLEAYSNLPSLYQETVFVLELVCRSWGAVAGERKSLGFVNGPRPARRLLTRWSRTRLNGAAGASINKLVLFNAVREKFSAKDACRLISLCPALSDLKVTCPGETLRSRSSNDVGSHPFDAGLILDGVPHPERLLRLDLAGVFHVASPLSVTFSKLHHLRLNFHRVPHPVKFTTVAYILQSLTAGWDQLELVLGRLNCDTTETVPAVEIFFSALEPLAPRLTYLHLELGYEDVSAIRFPQYTRVLKMIKSMKSLTRLTIDTSAWCTRFRIDYHSRTRAAYGIPLDFSVLSDLSPTLRNLTLICSSIVRIPHLVDYLETAKLAIFVFRPVSWRLKWKEEVVEEITDICLAVGTEFVYLGSSYCVGS
ncbi:hypothetical protein T439DRAFT_330205 [Meredithblackwellia eburnea MCA 4105]